MARTSNLLAVKRQILTDLKQRPALAGVQVEYSSPRDPDRELIFGGKAGYQQSYGGGRDGADTVRDENGTITLHLRVLMPGRAGDDAEARVVELVAEIEAYLAVVGPQVDGLLDARVESVDVESEPTDDAYVAYGTCVIATQAFLS